MKKAILVVMVVSLFLAMPLVAFSEEQASEPMPMMGKGMMMHKGEMKDMKPMHEMMMKKMMDKEIVATSDGGVVVMVGNKLYKYDKNLNLKAEAEIKIDYKAMKEKMKEKCSQDKEKIEEETAK